MFRQKMGWLPNFRESHLYPRKTAENPEIPDFISSFKSNERKLRPVKISARSDKKRRFFITSNFWGTFTLFLKTSNFLCFVFPFIHTSKRSAQNSQKWPKIAKIGILLIVVAYSSTISSLWYLLHHLMVLMSLMSMMSQILSEIFSFCISSKIIQSRKNQNNHRRSSKVGKIKTIIGDHPKSEKSKLFWLWWLWWLWRFWWLWQLC